MKYLIVFYTWKTGVLLKLFGYGFYIMKDDNEPPLFSERNGLYHVYRFAGLRVKLFTGD